MRIKMLTLMSKPTYTAKPGDVLELPAKEAESLIAGKFAVAVADDPVELADTKAKEAAAPKKATARGRGKAAGGDGDAGDEDDGK